MLPCISVLPNVRTFKHLQCFLSTGVVLYFVICCTWHYQYRLKIGLLVGEVLCHCIRSFYILPQHQAAFHLSYPWKYGSTVVACIFFPNIAKIFCHENDGGSQSIQGPLQSMKTLTRVDIHHNFWMISTTSWNYCENLLSQDSCIWESTVSLLLWVQYEKP